MEEPIIHVGIDSFNQLNFRPNADGNLEIDDVEIGKQFHWNKLEKQVFNGEFTVQIVDGKLLLINHILIFICVIFIVVFSHHSFYYR